MILYNEFMTRWNKEYLELERRKALIENYQLMPLTKKSIYFFGFLYFNFKQALKNTFQHLNFILWL